MKKSKFYIYLSMASCTLLAASAGSLAEASDSLYLQERMGSCALEISDELRLDCFDSITRDISHSDSVKSLPDEPSADSDDINTIAAAEEAGTSALHSGAFEKRLTTNDPNYIAAIAAPVSNDLNDDNHIEFYLSLKYPLIEPLFTKLKYADAKLTGTVVRPWMPDRLYFVYNGLYDFYFYESSRYDSSPVLSRLQNPGLTFEYDLSTSEDKVRLGWFHESNGQTLEKESTDNGDENINGSGIFQRRVDEHGEDYALASVSRGWDYASLRYGASENGDVWSKNGGVTPVIHEKSWYQYHIEYRWFCDCQAIVGDKEDDIWWEPGNRDEISDYDGLRFMAERGFKVGSLGLLGRIEYKSGLYSWDAMSNISWKATLITQWDNFSLMGFYFNGYGKEPSTYQLETQYVGLGIELR